MIHDFQGFSIVDCGTFVGRLFSCGFLDAKCKYIKCVPYAPRNFGGLSIIKFFVLTSLRRYVMSFPKYRTEFQVPEPLLMSTWEAFSNFFLKVGPFPAGIIVGIWLTKWAINKQFKYMSEEKVALREEKKVQLEYIKAQETRIDKLHDKLMAEK